MDAAVRKSRELYKARFDDPANGEERSRMPAISYGSILAQAAYGVSMGRGAFTFKRGAWTTVKQTITLGSGTAIDGSVVVEADGKTVISYNKVFFPSAHKGLFFST